MTCGVEDCILTSMTLLLWSWQGLHFSQQVTDVQIATLCSSVGSSAAISKDQCQPMYQFQLSLHWDTSRFPLDCCISIPAYPRLVVFAGGAVVRHIYLRIYQVVVHRERSRPGQQFRELWISDRSRPLKYLRGVSEVLCWQDL